jgi:hypothetical protein
VLWPLAVDPCGRQAGWCHRPDQRSHTRQLRREAEIIIFNSSTLEKRNE